MFMMKKYYSVGNLIVRTDSYDSSDEKDESPKIIKNPVHDSPKPTNLWKNKVQKNDTNNLKKENFPSLN